MPYIVQKAMEYRGEWLKPGDPLGDDHPKRSLRDLGKVRWIPAEGEPEEDPLAKSRDRSVARAEPPAPVKVVQPVERPRVEAPTVDEVIAAGYPRDVAAGIVFRQTVLRDLVESGVPETEAVEKADEALRAKAAEEPEPSPEDNTPPMGTPTPPEPAPEPSPEPKPRKQTKSKRGSRGGRKRG